MKWASIILILVTILYEISGQLFCISSLKRLYLGISRPPVSTEILHYLPHQISCREDCLSSSFIILEKAFDIDLKTCRRSSLLLWPRKAQVRVMLVPTSYLHPIYFPLWESEYTIFLVVIFPLISPPCSRISPSFRQDNPVTGAAAT